jgi:hypothetical protein
MEKELTMNLKEKLLEIQKAVSAMVKDATNTSDKYDYVSGTAVLNIIRPKMDELGLILIPEVKDATMHEGTTRSGTTRYLTEVFYIFTWMDVETGENMPVPWYAQGVDLAGEKGVGKAATYAEKTFLLKFFHVPTEKDDPDNDGRTKGGEKPTRGTAAAKENAEYYRKSILQMVTEIYGAEKAGQALLALTKNDARGYAGVDDVSKITAAALPVVYANVKKGYEKRTGHAFELTKEEETNGTT